MLPCKIRTGTPSRPKMPALIANPTGTMAGPETSPASNQHDNNTPGAINSTNAAAKGTNGKASRVPRRGTSRTAAAKHDSRTSTSGDWMRRVKDPLFDKSAARERIQPPTPSLKRTARTGTGRFRVMESGGLSPGGGLAYTAISRGDRGTAPPKDRRL